MGAQIPQWWAPYKNPVRWERYAGCSASLKKKAGRGEKHLVSDHVNEQAQSKVERNRLTKALTLHHVLLLDLKPLRDGFSAGANQPHSVDQLRIRASDPVQTCKVYLVVLVSARAFVCSEAEQQQDQSTTQASLIYLGSYRVPLTVVSGPPYILSREVSRVDSRHILEFRLWSVPFSSRFCKSPCLALANLLESCCSLFMCQTA